jgi:uncharacterized protein YyaL (SSP411 family)
MDTAGRQNRLARETSPYLLQHAGNPVDWYPWGEEALARARAEDRPILLSIGYSACHWCHVMERESFEDEAIAQLMNERFVCIKVDREERPDLDMIYMNAVQIMTGSGGWPLNIFLTPDLKPFYGGTYFPPDERHGMPSFKAVLERVYRAYREQRGKVDASGEQILSYVAQMSKVSPSREMLTDDLLRVALQDLKIRFDDRFGGWGPAPKFPNAAAIGLLLRIHRRHADEEALRMAERTLEKMALGGMYDQLGGGFHRYSTDAKWLAPHFEKMLYDNALLIPAYLEGYQVTRRPLFTRVARECLEYVLRDMTASEGGFCSAEDADSEGGEGTYYVWTPQEVQEAAGEEAARVFCAYYDVRPGGNWEHRSILHVSRPTEEVAKELGVPGPRAEQWLAEAKARLLATRAKRVRPPRDDKVLTSWNGLMISAFARGYQVLDEPRYLEAARQAARFILGELKDERGILMRTWRAGAARLEGCLDDYVFMAGALLDLYESDFDPAWIREARALMERSLETFWDVEDGAFFFTPPGQKDLVLRSKAGYDGAIPAGNSVAAAVLFRLGSLTGEERYGDRAVSILRAYREPMEQMPAAFSALLWALDLYLDTIKEVALVSPGAKQDAGEFLRIARQRFVPNKVVAFAPEERIAEAAKTVPLLEGKVALEGKPTAYLCEHFRCKAPTQDPEMFEKMLIG